MNFYDLKIKNKSGVYVNTHKYKGKVVLVVNTASKCGFAPQFEQLEQLYKEYNPKGLEIIAIPSDQFKQELKTSIEAQNDCKINHGVTFPLMGMGKVNGKNEEEIFTFLKSKKRTKYGKKNISWNFTKFLIDKNGNVVRRYGPSKNPLKFKKQIEQLLGDK